MTFHGVGLDFFLELHNSKKGSTECLVFPSFRVFHWIFAFPTVCDLFGTTLGGKK